MPGPFDVRPWLRIDEAAEFLTSQWHREVSAAEVLRLASDRQLPLCVWFPQPVVVVLLESGDQIGIEGLWDLDLTGTGHVEVERLYHARSKLPAIHVMDMIGVVVYQGDTRCRLPSIAFKHRRPISALPSRSYFVVRTSALQALAERLGPPATIEPPAPPVVETPLATRKERTLLTIIAALASLAQLDITAPAKSGESIEAETERLGKRVAARTIAEHLNHAAELLRQDDPDGKPRQLPK
jgi:hypothetical protein